MQPVIIIGAPRSGTNMLRDVITKIDRICTWPCDEINYIWRHGNARYPSDELPPERATPAVRQFINSAFERIASRYGADIVVEKTCANALRVEFVDRVVPNAKYIYIYRDGIDAVGSAKERWTAELDIPYLLRKVRYVPVVDMPLYASRYLGSRLYRIVSAERRVAFWGPKLDGMDEIVRHNDVNAICALQWQRCVERAETGLASLPSDRILRVRYECLVREPAVGLRRILDFLALDVSEEVIRESVKDVSSGSLGKGRRALGESEVARLSAMVSETLRRYGYD